MALYAYKVRQVIDDIERTYILGAYDDELL